MAQEPLLAKDIDRLINQPPRVQRLRRAIFAAADGLRPVVDLSRVYVDGLDNLPSDGRFVLVGNHTSAGWPEIVMSPYFVHRHLGVRVRGLAVNKVKELTGFRRDLAEALGAVPGQPDVGAELMERGETLLVFPGGGRDMLKFKGEEYRLMWQGRSGFARLAIAHEYPIVPVGLVGGDDVFRGLVERNGTWERLTRPLGERLHGLAGVGVPLMRGMGPTLLPRPQRMYLRFGQPISTTRPARARADKWEISVKQRTQTELEAILDDLQGLRTDDPFRNLNPLAWGAALQPS
ncbi:MAG: lysophospholipid acyltransferase family protein [Mycolicibacterium sp.]|uniref:lysophospholipid acyltransferase family protein n=1 Tax=Mycolicibacterium sp. TaxID=2320850 RepID=UPI003D120EE2